LPHDALFSANFIDRPFLQHVVEFVIAQGGRDFLVVGDRAEQARQILGDGRRWDVTIAYQQAYARPAMQPGGPREKFLLASAICLPMFPLPLVAERSPGTIIYGSGNREWTGWALLDERDVAAILAPGERVSVLAHLENLPDYEKLYVDTEYRCGGAQDIWKAHETALDSKLTGLCHNGLEVRPGVWTARNASIAASAVIAAPSYIGENSRIGAGAEIGPFAAIGKDCLIARHTIVRHSVVAPGTYAGDNLELDHVLADHNELFDVRFGVAVNDVGHSIVDSVFDLHWLAVPRQMLAAMGSALARIYMGALSKLRRRASSVEQPVEDKTLQLRIPPRTDAASHRDMPARGASFRKAGPAQPESRL
jgi:hypothetical protein